MTSAVRSTWELVELAVDAPPASWSEAKQLAYLEGVITVQKGRHRRNPFSLHTGENGAFAAGATAATQAKHRRKGVE